MLGYVVLNNAVSKKVVLRYGPELILLPLALLLWTHPLDAV